MTPILWMLRNYKIKIIGYCGSNDQWTGKQRYECLTKIDQLYKIIYIIRITLVKNDEMDKFKIKNLSSN